MNKKSYLFFYILLLSILCFFAITCGAVYLSPLKILHIFLNSTDLTDKVIFSVRIVRVLTSITVGASLALSGSILQRLLKNPLADPFILGISSGGTLFAGTAIILGLPSLILYIPIKIIYAFIGSFFTLVLLMTLKKRLAKIQDEFAIPIIGLILNSFYGAILMLIVSIASPEKGRFVYNLMIGNLQTLNLKQFLIFGTLIIIIIGTLLRYSSAIHAISFGDDLANSIGFNANKTRKFIFILISSLIAIVVSVSGSIGFIGLIVPHFAKKLHKDSTKLEWTASIFIGASLLVLADILGRTVAPPSELPAGLFTALIGAPALGVILFKRTSYE